MAKEKEVRRTKADIAYDVATNKLIDYLMEVRGYDRKAAIYLSSEESRKHIAEYDKIWRRFYTMDTYSYSITHKLDFEQISKDLKAISRSNVITSALDLKRLAILALQEVPYREIASKFDTNQQTVKRRIDFINKYTGNMTIKGKDVMH